MCKCNSEKDVTLLAKRFNKCFNASNSEVNSRQVPVAEIMILFVALELWEQCESPEYLIQSLILYATPKISAFLTFVNLKSPGGGRMIYLI